MQEHLNFTELRIVNMGVISNGTTLLDERIDSGLTGSMTLTSTLIVLLCLIIYLVIDSTYKEYIFKFIDIPSQTDVNFKFQFDTNGTNLIIM